MITPEYLSKIIQATEKRTADLNTSILRRIVDRILTYYEKTGEINVNPSSVYDVMKMTQSGKLLDDVVEEITKQMPDIQKEVRKAFYDTANTIAEQNHEFYKELIERNKISADFPDKAEISENEKSILDSFYRRTNGEIKNLAKTSAGTSQQSFIDAVDRATFNAQHGEGINKAICDAVDELAAKGITTVHYASGRTDKIEVAIARAVRTGINMANADIWLTGCAESGIDYVLVSSHLGARVTDRNDFTDHAHWQGKVYKLDWSKKALSKYSYKEAEKTFRGKIREFMLKHKIIKDYPDFVDECGYGEMLGICGINCRHTFSSYYPGSKNNNIQYDSEENKKRYELEQKQRAYERKIREYERRKAAFEELELSKDKRLSEAAQKRREDIESRLKDIKTEYNKFCKVNGLKKEQWRTKVAGNNIIVNDSKSDIIKSTTEEKGVEVHSVGKIDKKLYSCISDNMRTDEVVITDKQLLHIKERHPEAYDNAIEYVSEVLKNPDYIIQDKHPLSGLVIKKVPMKDENTTIVLRVCADNDPAEYKNSVITSWEISEKRLQNYLRNKPVLYKKE